MPLVHPTAVIEDGARLAADVSVGPFCHVGPEATLGEGVVLVSHVAVAGATTIGAGTKVYPNAALGFEPQSMKHKGGRTTLEIGRNCIIRESATIHAGSDTSRGSTVVGDNCFIMAYSHIAHDCVVGNNVTFANGATLAGHCEVGDFVTIAGLSAVHQFVRIGHHAFVGGASGIEGDVIPYGMAMGNRARLRGLNVIGMRRADIARSDIQALRQAYRLIFDRSRPMADNVAEARAVFGGSAIVGDVLDFLTTRARRHYTVPALKQAGDDGADDEG
jgi:UDP-N-acetylglucosamine acyltransferase